MSEPTFLIYTDGGARGNPGPAAIGFVIYNGVGQRIGSCGQKIGVATNNVAEYTALIQALRQALSLGARCVEVRMDSQLIVRQMQGLYKIKEPHLKVLALEVFRLRQRFRLVNFAYVPRKDNQEADHLVNKALDVLESGEVISSL